ncbi:hypothetical protein LR48_Vigan06g115500 [Vigna angularis]|uniref:Uncharacterized protein n=1 Tax=Phaseolus angularis TaxID=3914 RepID=A0A0L9UTH5_PHAAN|nr:hypothetical protein LR48_Vigan06g115500 [Vigna angularis]
MRSLGSIRTYLGGQDLGGRTFVYGGCDMGILWAAPVASWASFVRRPALPGTHLGSIRTYLGGQDLGGRTFVYGGCDMGVLWAAPVAPWASFVRRPTLPGSGSSGGVWEGSARGDSGDSPSSVSSYFLEEVVGSSGGGPESPVLTNDRIFHGVALFLLKGGIRVVGSPFEPDGQGTVVSELAPVVPSRKKSGASSSTARPTSVPKVPRPPPTGASTGRVPPTDKAGGSGVKVSGSSLPPELATVQVGPTSGAAMTSADPTRKRKDPTVEGRKDKEGSSSRSASKKARKDKGKEKDRERVLAVSLPAGVFSPDFSMSDRTKFHMSSSQRALIEPLSELELTNVRAELDREKKNAASLQVTLEEMVLNQDEYDKRIEQLEAELEKAKRESAEGLAAARIEQERLAEESRQKIDLLEAEVTRVKEAESCRAKANEELTLEVAKAKEQIAELESTILFEHEEGFNKALCQVTLLAGVQDPFALGVDIEKDVFNGVLVDLNAAEENEPTAEAAGGGKN